ncbi:MAG: dephospho-CoA kinase, partial [Clostridia bacterium]|nr:dephospho-CoA kinase [Clostridia bacterium]
MRIAIVGGIGSGKSEVLKVARDMGLACLSADEINSDLLNTPEYIAEIARAFPTAVCGGRIDRAILAKIVFSDDSARIKLNEIAHPRILARIREEKSSPLVVEMPLFLECGAQTLFDEVLFVYTPMTLRLERLEKRGLSRG